MGREYTEGKESKKTTGKVNKRERERQWMVTKKRDGKQGQAKLEE